MQEMRFKSLKLGTYSSLKDPTRDGFGSGMKGKR